MTKNIRNYIKQHGRTAARKKFGQAIDLEPITWEGKEVGTVTREWHSIYCTWTFKAVITWEGVVYSHTSISSLQECKDWAEKKIRCLVRPEFGKALKELIDLSGFTVEDVATEIKCSKGAIYKWIKGQSYPDIPFLLRICKLLAVMDWGDLYHEMSELIELERGE